LKEVRPTSGKVLQALFNIIGPVNGLSFLDLFAGTGRVSMEAWSRMAATVIGVELVRSRCNSVRVPSNNSKTREFRILCMNVRRAVTMLEKQGRSFDIIFADPPYESGWCKDLPIILSLRQQIIKSDGILIVEHSKRESVVTENTLFKQVDIRVYGDNVLEIFKKNI